MADLEETLGDHDDVVREDGEIFLLAATLHDLVEVDHDRFLTAIYVGSDDLGPVGGGSLGEPPCHRHPLDGRSRLIELIRPRLPHFPEDVEGVAGRDQ